MKGIKPKSNAFAWPTLAIDIKELQELHANQINPGNQYGLGKKIPLATEPEQADGMPVDCSGYVRWLLYQASADDDNPVIIPDGSVVQREWFEKSGLKETTISAGRNMDGIVRIYFLSPQNGGGIGHVVLTLNGETLESHGGTGPNSRQWTGAGWQGRCVGWVVAL